MFNNLFLRVEKYQKKPVDVTAMLVPELDEELVKDIAKWAEIEDLNRLTILNGHLFMIYDGHILKIKPGQYLVKEILANGNIMFYVCNEKEFKEEYTKEN